MQEEYLTNQLSKSSSPYLLQHAQNPVHWQSWSDETLQLAKERDKPLLVSIGYAACHWCHVMAHESFEDPATAKIMNDLFVCIKVDREELPDVDAVYMQAVQMMTGSGGWPLHVFALPDGRPFFGGTYFPKMQWQQICRAAGHEFDRHREKLVTFATSLAKGLQIRVPVINLATHSSFNMDLTTQAADTLKLRFDEKHGGILGAPKFPMPPLLNFLHEQGILNDQAEILSHVRNTLDSIALGGIYDHIGGGFARYSVDSRWKVPHFEKMLYDNAQLLSLYSKAYRFTPSVLIEERIRETADFLLREMRTQDGLFASSLDADSEGVEGKYYVWAKPELEEVLGDLYPFAEGIFNVNTYGYWENEEYILQMQKSYPSIAEELHIPVEDLQKTVHKIKNLLFERRSKRLRPTLDNKALVSWNAMAIEGLTDAYLALGNTKYLVAAQQAADFILDRSYSGDGELFHVFAGGNAYTKGFLEDYAFLIRALISLYQAALNESHLHVARSLLEYVFTHFLAKETGFFHFTPDDHQHLIRRDIDLTDGVLPSGNSVMAHNLIAMARYFHLGRWEDHAQKMMANMKDEIAKHPGSYSNWASLHLKLTHPYYDISILGKDVSTYFGKIHRQYHPNILLAGNTNPSDLPILSNRFQVGKTLAYICTGKACKEVINSPEELAMALSSL